MMLLVLLAVTANLATAANLSREEGKGTHDNCPKKENIHKSMMAIIKSELSLDDKKFEAFAPVYGEYRKALRGNEPKGERINPETATDEEVITLLNRNLDHQIRIATVRKEYIPKFGKVLTARQIAKLYRIDNTLAKRAHEQLNKRDSMNHPGRKPAQPHNGAPHARHGASHGPHRTAMK